MALHMLFRSPDGELVKVKAGFSWQAFFVGSAKAMVRRTWLIALVVIVLGGMYAWMGSEAFAASSRTQALVLALLGLYVLYMLFCGIYGNRWLVASLLRRGFRKIGEEK
jgi:hypothetical protein